MNREEGKFYCIYCEDEVTDAIIECGECSNITLCLQCFSCGAEIGDHKRSHKYRVVQIASLFGENDGWTTKEDVLLLYALLKFGPNWDVIATKLKKTTEEVKTHYVNRFVESEFAKKVKSNNGVSLVEDYEPTDDDIYIDKTSRAYASDGTRKSKDDLTAEKENDSGNGEKSKEEDDEDTEDEDDDDTQGEEENDTEEEEDENMTEDGEEGDENAACDEEEEDEEEEDDDDDDDDDENIADEEEEEEEEDDDDDDDENTSEDEEESMDSDDNAEECEEG